MQTQSGRYLYPKYGTHLGAQSNVDIALDYDESLMILCGSGPRGPPSIPNGAKRCAEPEHDSKPWLVNIAPMRRTVRKTALGALAATPPRIARTASRAVAAVALPRRRGTVTVRDYVIQVGPGWSPGRPPTVSRR